MAIETQETNISWNGIDIGEVVSFTGPGGTSGTFDVTHLKSTKREKMAALPDEGDYTLECNFVPTDPGQIALLQDRTTRTVREVIVTYSDSSTDTFDAYCTSAVKSGGVDNKVTISFTLAITGDITSDYLES